MHCMGALCRFLQYMHAQKDSEATHGVDAEVWGGRVGGGFVVSQNC